MSSLLCDGEGTFHFDYEKYIWDLAPDKLTIQRNLQNQRSRSQKRSLSAKKLNVTILILRSMAKTPCGYNIRLGRYFYEKPFRKICEPTVVSIITP